MKTAISIPDPLFRAADRLARRLGVSRSQVFQRAVSAYLKAHEDANVTDTTRSISPDMSRISGSFAIRSMSGARR
ncbi:MAG: ribbon-helix-helix protein, CopG family [Candidatus Eisenbacteria bacterium]|uniref:Ribbon-helix-helix protein, CopG family n=1 Tax=Eiseniibacteriota bacterium TaxID=2212470 RepID=A0A538SIV5_UNCEI|nr:MAG: ribbon-helix-helix protein, CopG family [Candidatus Eisenbacteria bacterium]